MGLSAPMENREAGGEQQEGGKTQVKAEGGATIGDRATEEGRDASADGAPGATPTNHAPKVVDNPNQPPERATTEGSAGSLPPSARESQSTAPGQSGWVSGLALLPNNPAGAQLHSLAAGSAAAQMPLNANMMCDAMDQYFNAMQQQVR